MQLSPYSLGSLVTVKRSFLNEPAGVVAYVYEHYSIDNDTTQGISLITQNGVDLGGFSLQEQYDYLEYYGDTGQVYTFSNVTQLKIDWDKGVFKMIFDNLLSFKKELKTKSRP